MSNRRARYSFQAPEIDRPVLCIVCVHMRTCVCTCVCTCARVCVYLRLDSLPRSSLHAALWARYGIGDDELLHQVAIGLEADGLPGLCGEWIQLPKRRGNIERLNAVDITKKKDCLEF